LDLTWTFEEKIYYFVRSATILPSFLDNDFRAFKHKNWKNWNYLKN